MKNRRPRVSKEKKVGGGSARTDFVRVTPEVVRVTMDAVRLIDKELPRMTIRPQEASTKGESRPRQG